MTPLARVAAQAKINLVLHVLARETSGYHSIETVFQRLELADDVAVRVTTGRSLDCSGPAMPAAGLGPTEQNLAFRAAVAYADATGWPGGFAIELVKHIPAGAGLGGGSSDAGAVLRALDALAPRPLRSELSTLAVGLGADVPFMAIDHPIALAWGRGERLLPLSALESRPTVILTPDFPIATADAYRWLASDRGDYVPLSRLIDPVALESWGGVATIASNDFQGVVAERHPVIEELVGAQRAAGARVALLAGSGSSVFGIFDSASTADALARRALDGVGAVVTRTADRIASVERDE